MSEFRARTYDAGGGKTHAIYQVEAGDIVDAQPGTVVVVQPGTVLVFDGLQQEGTVAADGSLRPLAADEAAAIGRGMDALEDLIRSS